MPIPRLFRLVTLIAAVITLIVRPSVVPAQQTVAADLPSRIDAVFARFTRATPGCGVGVSKDGHAVYTHGYGSANLEYGVPNTDSTVFESGSVAKQFTASAMILLAQDGKLSLDDDIRKYLPEVPSFGGQKITIRNLLTQVEVPASELARWAATYRDPHTDQTVTLTAASGALSSGGAGGRGGALFVPEGGNRFRGPQGEAVFSGVAGKRGFILVRADADTARFEEVVAAPATIPVSDYPGTYASDELDVRFTVVARDGKLFLRRRPADEFELRPVYRDDFQSGGGVGTVRFARDGRGVVTGLAFFAGRVLDVRFTREQGSR